MQKSLISRVGSLLVELAHNGNILCECARSHESTSLFQNLVNVKRLGHQVELSSVSHGKREQAFHNPSQFLELVTKVGQSLSIFFSTSGFGEQQFSLTMKNGERCAQFMRSIGHKLTQLTDG